MILFSSHINCSTTKTIQNIFMNMRAIKVPVVSDTLNIKIYNCADSYDKRIGCYGKQIDS